MPRTIGEVAAHHGLAAHVLRHWEDVGALLPERSPSGHRRYGPVHDAQIELIKCGRTAGLSLEEIAKMLHGPQHEREPVLRDRLKALERAASEIEASQRLLLHALTCETPAACPQCSRPHGAFGFPSPKNTQRPAADSASEAPER
ncbi:MerR family transcriptional regulator [Streptomyces sp. NPDC087218]|uniref:MerR family transcriptional regulator n=1 Tax=Streptomyces sp. NPDC087218 TaxID=3365769 RepID=UPI0037FA3715